MRRSILAPLGIPVLALGLAMSAGCATTSQLEEVKAMAQKAQATAEQAMAKSADASATAQAAQQHTMATDQKIDQMFKKTMMK